MRRRSFIAGAGTVALSTLLVGLGVRTVAAQQDLLGLHATRADLDLWAQRSRTGPYARRGDAGSNSPGTWTEAANNASGALALFTGPTEMGAFPNGCVGHSRDAIGDGDTTALTRAKRVCDTAFYGLTAQNHTVMDRVARHLVAQTNHRDTRFADRDRWCLGPPNIGGHDGLGHALASWAGYHAVAIDWVQTYERSTDRTLLTDTQRTAMHDWLAGLGVWLESRSEAVLNECFVDRPAGNYTLTATGRSVPGYSAPLFRGGPTPRMCAIRFSNKFTNRARAYGLIGALTGRAELLQSSRVFFQDFLRFAYFPHGATSDFHRCNGNGNAKQGWKYSATQVGCLLHIAGVLALRGDRSLIDHTTTDGAEGSQGPHHDGGPKTVRSMTEDLCRYVPGVPGFYGRVNPQGERIEPRDRIEDMALAVALRHLDSTRIDQAVQRRTHPWPANPAQGKHGDRGLHTASLLMYV